MCQININTNFKYLIVIIAFLATLNIFIPKAIAQTSNNINYPSTILTDLNNLIELSGNTYVIPDSSNNVTRGTIRDMIMRGYLLKYRSESKFINLGTSGVAVWLVFPVSSIAANENWVFNLGELSNGRFGTLKQFDLYDLSRGKTLFTSQLNSTGTINNIPKEFYINLGNVGQTTYLAAYIRTPPATLTILSPHFKNNSIFLFGDFLFDNLVALLSIIVCVSLLIISFIKRSSGYSYLSGAWAIILFNYLFIDKFIYQNFISPEFISPMIIFTLIIMFVMASWKTYKINTERPISLYLGMIGILAISSIAVGVLSKAIPSFSIGVMYIIPTIIAVSIAYINLKRSSAVSKFLNIAISYSLIFISLSNISFLLLASGFMPQSSVTIYMPHIFVAIAALLSFVALLDGQQNIAPQIIQSKKEKNPIINEETDEFRDVIEKSDHRRLMQVIEQERKSMSEMKLQAAKQTEEMRLAKESADEANRAKSAFLAVVSHEIRTPMTGIMGMLRMLQDTTLNKEQANYASTIKDSGDALLALLNDILDFEKIESGKMELESISFDLRRLLNGIHTLMKGHADFKNVNLVLELDPKTPTWVIGDPTRLRQVLLNLINNAIKFTAKGDVTIRIQDLTSSDDVNSYNIYFAVQDSGIGISPDAQKKLFMPFAQADSSVSRKYGGTGLGLTICKRLIDAMGGSISISSKENEGSTFFFTLRMDVGVANNEDFPEEQHDITEAKILNAIEDIFFNHSLKILVVDDNLINQKVVSGFLEKLGVDYTTAGTGKEVLEMIEREKFSAILMDLQLPDMNGIEITKNIRNNYNIDIASVPIIAFTGNTAQDDIEECRNAGMNDFAAKPISYEKIAELMQKADGQINFRWVKGGNDAIDDDLSPLMRHSIKQESQHNEIVNQINVSDIDLHEDSFANAVEQFEQMERAKVVTTIDENLVKLDQYGLDETMLKSLIKSLGVIQTQEILVSFYDKADELIAEIGSAFLDGNLPSLYARAHELKGMAGNFGFADLNKLCAVIEKAAKNSDPSMAKDEVDQLGERYSISRTFLNKWIENQK